MADVILFTSKGRRVTEGLTCDKKRLHERNILIPSKPIPVSIAISKKKYPHSLPNLMLVNLSVTPALE